MKLLRKKFDSLPSHHTRCQVGLKPVKGCKVVGFAVQEGCHMYEVPGAGRDFLRLLGAQVVAGAEQVGNSLPAKDEPVHFLRRPVSVPCSTGIATLNFAQVMTNLHTQNRIPNEFRYMCLGPLRHSQRELVSRMEPCDQKRTICVADHRRRRWRSSRTGLGSFAWQRFCASQTGAMISSHAAALALLAGLIWPMTLPLRVTSNDWPCSTSSRTALVS